MGRRNYEFVANNVELPHPFWHAFYALVFNSELLLMISMQGAIQIIRDFSFKTVFKKAKKVRVTLRLPPSLRVSRII